MELTDNAVYYKACISTVADLRKCRVNGHEQAAQKCLQFPRLAWNFMYNCVNVNLTNDFTSLFAPCFFIELVSRKFAATDTCRSRNDLVTTFVKH